MMGQAFPNTISRTAAVVAPGSDGDGDHPVHGQGVGRAPEPCRQRRVLRCAATSPGGACRATSSSSWSARRSPACSSSAVIDVSATYGSNYPAAGYLGLAGVPDGGGAHARARQRDPRHGLGRAEHRHLRGVRRRRLHRARRPLGQPDLGRVDEPGPHVRARPRRRRLHATTGSTSPARSLGAAIAVGFAWVLRGAGGGRAGSGAAQGDLDTEVERPDQA